jgi:thiol-disulfide isomerase/thioredoxin
MAATGIVAGLAGLVALACGRQAPAPAAPPPLTPANAADVLREVERSRGSVVLVNVWATWCTPCREEFPDLLRVQSELGSRGFRLILVSADFASQRPAAAAFLASQGVGSPTFAKAQGDQEFINGLDSRWSGALPACLLFDREGRKVGFWEGKASYDDLTRRINPLLGSS